MDERLLGIYLNDHLAASGAGIALARRCAANNRGNAVSDVLQPMIRELEEDRETLLQTLGVLGHPRDALKELGGWALEKVGRLKLNGRLLRYSPLSRVLELETLRSGIEGRMAMLQLLQRLQRSEPRLARFDYAGLTERAERQKRQVERLRLAAADVAFAGKHVLEVGGEAPAGA